MTKIRFRARLSRKESRGLHYIIDYPHQLSEAEPTILTPKVLSSG